MKKINEEKYEMIDKTVYLGKCYKLWESKIYGDERAAIVTDSQGNILDRTWDTLSEWIHENECELN